jgi:hypothetical protein
MSMRARSLFVVGAVCLVSLLALPASAQTAEPWVGTWKLNAAKSTYSPGPAPKNGRITTTAVKGGIHQVNRTDPLTGPPTTSEVTAMFDGKDYPVKGNPNADMQAFTKIDDHSYQIVSKKGGKVTLTSKVVISADGKTRTTTQTGTDAQGKTVSNTIVYEKM